MHEHRLASSLSIDFYPFNEKFSCFHFLDEKKLLSNPAIHRCFSLARAVEGTEKSMIWECLSPAGEGIINEENTVLRSYFSDYECKALYRVSFWREKIDKKSVESLSSENLIGYLIIKNDYCPSQKLNDFHVFEAVFPKYAHPHNCSNGEKGYQVCIANKLVMAYGVIFCQQNSIFKCCAHVALFSILSLSEADKEISFAKMNQIAGIIPPDTGLRPEAIRKILSYYGIDFFAIDYDECEDQNIKKEIPFQRLAYAGIESGGGALVGFSLDSHGGECPERHMIPFFGHTFNKDTWVPHADNSYFHFSSALAYIPSDSWTSSFIGHDDNFGANFCIPKLYIEKENVNFIVEIFRPGVKYSALIAEIYALQFLYSIIDGIDIYDAESNFWLYLLKGFIRNKKIILRAIALKKEEYFSSLKSLKDFTDGDIIDTVSDTWPDVFWIVEISLP